MICPTFDPVSWLSRVNQYFGLNEIRRDKVKYVKYYLEGEANVWWQWLSRVYRKKGREIRWKDFEREILVHFGPSSIMIMMRHYRISSKQVRCGTIKKSLKNWQTGFVIGLKRL